jgi:3-oxoacyl-[acyl-carrier-protein] synthase II
MHVAITGMGVVSSIGITTATFYDALLDGRCGVRAAPWASPDDPHPSPFGTVHDDFDPSAWVDPRLEAGVDRHVAFALAAVDEALRQAGRLGDGSAGLDPLRTAVIGGTSMGGFYSLQMAQSAFERGGREALSPKTMLRIWTNMATAHLTMRHGLHGPTMTITTACASSLDAVGLGAQMIEAGIVDVAVCGGTEGGFPSGHPDSEGFVPATSPAGALLGVESREPDLDHAVCPFGLDRSGIVFGEGAGWFVLESDDELSRRDGTALAWLAGFGSCADAHHPVGPEPNGRWEARAMDVAREGAELDPGDIDLVVAHATGTEKGDAAEAAALATVFGGSIPPVTSIKGHTGHPGASAGAMSLAAAILMLERQEVVGIAGTTEVDPAIDLDLVVGPPRRPVRLDAVQVNAFGFGGQDASVVIGRG